MICQCHSVFLPVLESLRPEGTWSPRRGFDLGCKCHECSHPANTWLPDIRAPLEAVTKTDALNDIYHTTYHTIPFEMLMWINMAFDLCVTNSLYMYLGLWNLVFFGILWCATGLAKCSVSMFSRTSETHTFRQRQLFVLFCICSIQCLWYDLIVTLALPRLSCYWTWVLASDYVSLIQTLVLVLKRRKEISSKFWS